MHREAIHPDENHWKYLCPGKEYEVGLEPVASEGPQAAKRGETGKRYQEQELGGKIWAEDSLSLLVYNIKLARVRTSTETSIKWANAYHMFCTAAGLY